MENESCTICERMFLENVPKWYPLSFVMNLFLKRQRDVHTSTIGMYNIIRNTETVQVRTYLLDRPLVSTIAFFSSFFYFFFFCLFFHFFFSHKKIRNHVYLMYNIHSLFARLSAYKSLTFSQELLYFFLVILQGP